MKICWSIEKGSIAEKESEAAAGLPAEGPFFLFCVMSGESRTSVNREANDRCGPEEAEAEGRLIAKRMTDAARELAYSCTQMITPFVTLTSGGKNVVIVVNIMWGGKRLYYLTSKVKEKKTYIRVFGTTRIEEPFIIKT